MKTWAQRLVASAAFAVLAALALPSGAAAQPIALFTTEAAAGGLSVFQANANGSLSPAPGSPHPTGDESAGVAVTPDGRHAYVANFADDTVSSFALAVDGSASPIGAPVPAGDRPTDVAVTPDGGFVLVTNRASATPRVSVFAVAANGSLSAVAGSPFNPGIFDPRAVAVSPDGQYAYVSGRRGPDGPPPTNAERALAVLEIEADGGLAPIGGSPFYGLATNPFEITIAPNGQRLFMTGLTGNRIEVFALNQATGAPSAIVGSPFVIGNSPLHLVSDPTGTRLLVGNAGAMAESVGTATINQATGALTAGSSQLALPTDPHGFAVAPSGTRAYSTVTSNPATAVGFSIGPAGTLAALPGSPYSLSSEPDNFPGFFSASVAPVQTPQPAIANEPFKAGKPKALDASGTVIRGGSASRYDWDFGDGTTLADGGPKPTHTYAEAGTYTAEVTVTNDCNPLAPASAGVVSVGNQIYCNGPRTASTTRQIRVTDEVEATVKAKRTQKQRRKISIKVKVRAQEAVTVRLTGKIKKAGKAKIKARKVKVAAGKRKTVKLKAKQGGKRVLRKLGSGKKGKAKLKAKLTDDLGTKRVDRLTVKLKSARKR